MITVTFLQQSGDLTGGLYCGFAIEGHAGYARRGKDIICASVSALAINCINSIERFTEDAMETECNEKTGYLRLLLTESVSKESQLLLDSLMLGLQDIQESYGSHYINIRFEEV